MSDHGLPSALEDLGRIGRQIGRRRPAFFLDFDATLVPLEPHPDLVEMPSATRALLATLAADHVVCIVSGRELGDVRAKVGLDVLYYAADHGYRIEGPPDSGVGLEVGPEDRHDLEAAAYRLEQQLRDVPGVLVETKGVSLAVHYRMVAEPDKPLVRQAVTEVARSSPSLKLTGGKMVHELRPDVVWDKGRAVRWLLKRLRLEKHQVCPICVGDDLTDEDMFAVVVERGIGIVVGDPGRPTQATFMLRDHGETAAFLRAFTVPTGRARASVV